MNMEAHALLVWLANIWVFTPLVLCMCVCVWGGCLGTGVSLLAYDQGPGPSGPISKCNTRGDVFWSCSLRKVFTRLHTGSDPGKLDVNFGPGMYCMYNTYHWTIITLDTRKDCSCFSFISHLKERLISSGLKQSVAAAGGLISKVM